MPEQIRSNERTVGRIDQERIEVTRIESLQPRVDLQLFNAHSNPHLLQLLLERQRNALMRALREEAREFNGRKRHWVVFKPARTGAERPMMRPDRPFGRQSVALQGPLDEISPI